MYSEGVEKVVQLEYSWTFPGVITGNSPAVHPRNQPANRSRAYGHVTPPHLHPPRGRTNHTGALDFLHVPIRSGDLPVAAVQLTGSFRRRLARHLYSEKGATVTTEEEPGRTDRAVT